MPEDIRQRLLQRLDEALALDATIPDLHWDVAVIHGRFTGNHDAAATALDGAMAHGMQHPLVPTLQALIIERRTPERPDPTPAGELRGLLFRLTDDAVEGDLAETGPPSSPPASFADYVRAAQATVHAVGAEPGAATEDLLKRFHRLRDARLVTADALDFGLEFVFRAAEAGYDEAVAREALDDLADFLASFAFQVSGGKPNPSDLRKVIRIARRGLDLVEGTPVPLAPDRHADLWLALGQGSGRPGNLHLHDALTAYTKALRLKREAGNTKDVDRLTALSQQMLDYAVQLGVGAYLGNGSLDAALANPEDSVFFDAGTTQMRAGLVERALAAGKHVYCEKPIADDLDAAVRLARTVKASGLKHGVVQDKLFLPGLMKLALLRDSGFFGKMLSVRGEFGYRVFEGDWQPAQRPSWNYRLADGGGIILGMLCHWRYVLGNLFAEVKAVSCLGATHIPERVDERGERYRADADDAACATFEPEGGIVAHINSSWAVRVRRDDLVTFQVDGAHGSAVAGLHTDGRSTG